MRHINRGRKGGKGYNALSPPSYTQRKKLATLIRRLHYMKKKEEEVTSSWQRAEIVALEWAINRLKHSFRWSESTSQLIERNTHDTRVEQID